MNMQFAYVIPELDQYIGKMGHVSYQQYSLMKATMLMLCSKCLEQLCPTGGLHAAQAKVLCSAVQVFTVV